MARDLRALASLLRGGSNAAEAFAQWHRVAPDSVFPLARWASSARLGIPPERVLERTRLGPVPPALGTAFALHARLGGNLAAVIDHLATSVDVQAEAAHEAEAASAGARLSAYLVAGLPFLFLPVSIATGSLRGAGDDATVILGMAMGTLGLLWIRRLVPSPPDVLDGVDLIVEVVAAAIEGGALPAVALREAARHAPSDVEPDLERAERLVRLGIPWGVALGRSSHEGLRSVAGYIRRTETSGEPLVRHLRAERAARAAAIRRDFGAGVRKAPVLMVLPLSLCVLPSFLLLGLMPLLRTLYPSG